MKKQKIVREQEPEKEQKKEKGSEREQRLEKGKERERMQMCWYWVR